MGEQALEETERQLEVDSAYALTCKDCSKRLRPWQSDDVWIVRYHVEDHYNIPLETSGKKASKELRKTIFRLYGDQCFGCGCSENLKIDHVYPQSRGGTAAFRNLQALCEDCNQRKGDLEPEEIEVVDDMHFFAPPSDAYEGLFW